MRLLTVIMWMRFESPGCLLLISLLSSISLWKTRIESLVCQGGWLDHSILAHKWPGLQIGTLNLFHLP